MIRVSFSRAIKLNLDPTNNSAELVDKKSGEKGRQLSKFYSEEEKELLAQLLTIEYDSSTDDGQEKSQIVGKEVVTATDTLLEIKLTHSKPAAVSRDIDDRDTITIRFDQSIWDDPLTEVEVNEGQPLIIYLPR